MICLILAAGDAERLDGLPKPYVRIGRGSPVERMAAAMGDVVDTPYLIARMEDAALAGGIHNCLTLAQHPMSPARRVRWALDEIRGMVAVEVDVIVAMGDMLFGPDLPRILRRLTEREMDPAGSLVLAAHHRTKAGLKIRDERVSELNPFYLRDIGIHRLGPKLRLPDVDGSVISMLMDAGPVEYQLHSGDWWDLATARDLARAQALFAMTDEESP